MKNLKALTGLFLAACVLGAPAFAQLNTCNTATIPICQPGTGNGDVQIKPQAVPTSTTVVSASDAFLKVITVENPTASAISFSLCDRQASPVCVAPAVSIAANTTYIISWPDLRLYWAPGGFTALASGAGLTFSGAFRQ
jgi:hypothetical protein